MPRRGRSRSFTVTLVVGIVALLALFAAGLAHNFSKTKGPDEAQSSPYWTSWSAWQKSSTPIVSSFTRSFSAVTNDYAELGVHDTKRNARILANDLVQLGVATSNAQLITKCPDAKLNAVLTNYVGLVNTFETRFVAGLKKPKPHSFGWVRGQLETILAVARNEESLWINEVQLYNSL